MKNIQLKKMHIENFKGISLFDISFGAVTNIIGGNGVGKTSLHDAYLWTLTGEDSNECSSFKVQPLEADGKTKKKVDTKVEVEVSINGECHTFCRVFAQQWSTPRGSAEEVQGANTSSYYVDGLPKKYMEYRDIVKLLFCDIENFKLLSSLTAFCNLETKTRRRKLLEMAGDMPELINATDYPNLYPLYTATKDIDGIKAKMNFEKNKLEVEQASIPDKMTENERNLPSDIDFDALKKEKTSLETEIGKIDAVLQKSAATRNGIIADIDIKKKEIFDLQAELSEIDNQLNKQILAKKDELAQKWIEKKGKATECEQKIQVSDRKIGSLKNEIDAYENTRQSLAKQWKEKDAEVFDAAVNDKCPTCGRVFTQEELIEMKNALVRAFNEGKSSVLEQIASRGNKVVEDINKLTDELNGWLDEKTKLEGEYKALTAEVNKIGLSKDSIPNLDFLRQQSIEYQNLLGKIAEKKTAFAQVVPEVSEEENELKSRKALLVKDLAECNMMLGQEVMIDKVAKRREELKAEDVRLTEQIDLCSAVLSEIKEYEKANMLAVEEKVSSMFKFVKWKMYEKNLTNDGEKEICECVVDGVPYSTNLNTAKIVNAGIDIVNAISKWLGMVVPVWVDGKESVTDLIDTDSQLITLSVVNGAKLQVAPEGASY